MGIAYAMGQIGGAGATGGTGGFLATPLVPIILMLAVMWFFLIRPQQKKQKEHRNMISNLKKGDRIITSGGLYGRVTGVAENMLTMEIADKVRVKVSRGHIAGMAQPTADAKDTGNGENTRTNNPSIFSTCYFDSHCRQQPIRAGRYPSGAPCNLIGQLNNGRSSK